MFWCHAYVTMIVIKLRSTIDILFELELEVLIALFLLVCTKLPKEIGQKLSEGGGNCLQWRKKMDRIYFGHFFGFYYCLTTSLVLDSIIGSKHFTFGCVANCQNNCNPVMHGTY